MSQRRILVTGGAGFIGTRLVERLVETGFVVRVLDNLSVQIHGAGAAWPEQLLQTGVELIRGSVTRRADWVRACDGVEAVAHLAAETGTGQSMYEIARYNEVNVQGTAILLDLIAQNLAPSVNRVVLTSSRSVYGEGRYGCRYCGLPQAFPSSRSGEALAQGRWEMECPACGATMQPLPTQEKDPTNPASIYAATKLAQEDLVRIACGALGVGYTILRLQNVYGEGQSLNNPYTGILSIFSTKIRRGLPLTIFEDGKETRDFVHIADVAEALLRALSGASNLNTIINVGSGLGVAVSEVARLLSEKLGSAPRLKVTGEYRRGDIRHNIADIRKLRDQLDFVPTIELDQGLARFAAWVSAQPLPDDMLEHANSQLRERNLMG
jgi:dTDP-L-rhamnose 4-epimerase